MRRTGQGPAFATDRQRGVCLGSLQCAARMLQVGVCVEGRRPLAAWLADIASTAAPGRPSVCQSQFTQPLNTLHNVSAHCLPACL